MSQHWMVDTLADLRQFARKNSMNQLAEHLDDAIIVAARETACPPSIAQRVMSGHDIAVGYPSRQARDREFS